MRTETINIYQYAELSEKAKERARDWYRDGMDFFWNDESRASIKTFCAHFGANLIDWNIGPYSPIDYKVEYDNSNFRGLKLKQFNRENMPTGYYLDCALWQTFYDVFKKTGNAKIAFESAVYEGFKEWRDDMEYQLSDSAVEETILTNEYEFLESGKPA